MLVFDSTVEKMDKLLSAVDEIGSPGLATVYAPVSDEFHEEPHDTSEGSSCVEAKEERMAFRSVCGGCRFSEPSCHCGMSTSDDDSSDDGSKCELILRLRQKFSEERERKKLAEESERKKLVEESKRKKLAEESIPNASLESEAMDEDCCPCGRVDLCDCMDSPSGIVSSSSDNSDEDACEEDKEGEVDEEHAGGYVEGEEEGDDKGEEEAGEKGEREAKSKRKESEIKPDSFGGAGPGVDFGRAARARQGITIEIVTVSSFPMLTREGDINKLRQRYLGLQESFRCWRMSSTR